MGAISRPSGVFGSERGFVLVAVLWLLAALAALAAIFSAFLANSARAIAVNDNALQTEALVSAAVELTAYQLGLSGEARPARGSFHTRLNGAEMSVSCRARCRTRPMSRSCASRATRCRSSACRRMRRR
ncbi:hypothetical protein [Bradyrhizobium sp. STM 3557]|uniref:hypothetical protein n=1 Tax=Bradyrhizobium sp. STM 3557 TaxID=578920 RepID=UPI003890F156